jgi:hypothetical protein
MVVAVDDPHVPADRDTIKLYTCTQYGKPVMALNRVPSGATFNNSITRRPSFPPPYRGIITGPSTLCRSGPSQAKSMRVDEKAKKENMV